MRSPRASLTSRKRRLSWRRLAFSTACFGLTGSVLWILCDGALGGGYPSKGAASPPVPYAENTPSAAPAARIDDAVAMAMDAIKRYTNKGFTLRDHTWGGELAPGTTKAITQQLFRRNEYALCAATNVKDAGISVHVYDQDGNLVEQSSWHEEKPEGGFAGATILPEKTGTYFVIVKVEKSPLDQAAWGLVYAYR